MDTVKFCALDISTVSTGVAILKYNDYFKKIEIIDKTSLVIKKKQYYDKVKDRKILHPFNKQASMIKLFDYYIKDKIDDISFFVLENYSYKSLGLIANIAEVVSLFKYYLFQNRKYYDTISPSEVKKIITLSGNSRKDKVQKKIYDFILNSKTLFFNNYDESDAVAVGIAYYIKMMNIIEENE